jgi:hypothetical protein
MTRQVLNRGTIANDGTGDTLRTASLKIEQNFLEIYQKLGDGSSLMSLIDFDSSAIIYEGSIENNNETRLVAVNPTQDNVVSIPDHTGVITLDTNTQTLTNKTLTSPVLTTPQINDTSANHQYLITPSELAADRTATLPLLGANDEFTFNNHAAVLKNKTIQKPHINSPHIGLEILDSAGNELIQFQDSSNATNFIRIGNSPTSVPAIVQAAGEANSALSLKGSGIGAVRIDSRLALSTQNLSTNGAVSSNDVVTLLTKSTTGAHTLADGTTGINGEVKYIVNKGAGTQTVSETGTNLAGYSSITLPQNSAATLMWFNNQWIIINTFGSTPNA